MGAARLVAFHLRARTSGRSDEASSGPRTRALDVPTRLPRVRGRRVKASTRPAFRPRRGADLLHDPRHVFALGAMFPFVQESGREILHVFEAGVEVSFVVVPALRVRAADVRRVDLPPIIHDQLPAARALAHAEALLRAAPVERGDEAVDGVAHRDDDAVSGLEALGRELLQVTLVETHAVAREPLVDRAAARLANLPTRTTSGTESKISLYRRSAGDPRRRRGASTNDPRRRRVFSTRRARVHEERGASHGKFLRVARLDKERQRGQPRTAASNRGNCIPAAAA